VSVLIPRTERTVLAPQVAAPAQARKPASGTILVVEDYPDLRELFEEILSAAGYRVLVAADGAEAIAVAERHEGEIALLLTDIVMPNMLGTDLARELRLRHPDLRVLFMSGHSQAVIGSATPLPPGAKPLQKPFMEAELLARVGEVLAPQ
jgi:DNA-binding response OmpR family regulator